MDRALQELTEDGCWELLDSSGVGRLAWNGGEGITVLPVNFSLDGRAVLVRTASYSALGRECDDSLVAFEVDHHDPVARSGWSVLVRGRAHVDFDASPGSPDVDVWPLGPRPLHVRVEPTHVTGRRLSGEG